jgi:ammonium transporter, Amt family
MYVFNNLFKSFISGLFADKDIAALNGEIIHGGVINGHSIQLGYQIASSVAGLAYSFCITALILYIMDRIPCLKLRMEPEEEEIGTDEAELGEPAYYFLDRAVNSMELQIQSKIISAPQQPPLFQSTDSHLHYS